MQVWQFFPVSRSPLIIPVKPFCPLCLCGTHTHTHIPVTSNSVVSQLSSRYYINVCQGYDLQFRLSERIWSTVTEGLSHSIIISVWLPHCGCAIWLWTWISIWCLNHTRRVSKICDQTLLPSLSMCFYVCDISLKELLSDWRWEASNWSPLWTLKKKSKPAPWQSVGFVADMLIKWCGVDCLSLEKFKQPYLVLCGCVYLCSFCAAKFHLLTAVNLQMEKVHSKFFLHIQKVY